MPSKQSNRHVVEAFLDEAWMIHEPKLREIVSFLELRAAGMALSADQIREVTSRQQAASFAQTLGEDDDDEDKPVIVDGVQVLQLYGTLAPRMNLLMSFSGGTSTQQFSQAIAKAAADPKVKTILIEVDSPGGAVSGTEEARQALLRAKAAKRVVVVGRNLMASAAYYIAAAGTEVYATPSTEVGSIGVYAVINTAVKAAEEAGLKFYVLRAGELKAAGNPYEELTAERQAALQKRVDDPYAMFLGAVAADRRVSVETVKESFGRGSVVLADEAKRLGMIDNVAMIEDVFDAERRRNRQSVSVPGGFSAAAAALFQKDSRAMNKKIKAALFARGLVDSPDAEDAVCQVALHAFLTARGVAVAGDEAVLTALLADAPKAVLEAQEIAPPAANVADAHKREMEEARAAERVAERTRIADLTAAAETLHVDAADLQAAIAGGLSHEAALKQWVAKLAQKEKALPKGTISPAGTGEDRWAADAVDALMYRLADSAHKPQINDGARQLTRAPLWMLARQSLAHCGVRVDEYATAEEIAERAMAQAGAHRVAFYSPRDGFVPAAADSAYNRPGMFPHLLSNLANKYLDAAVELAEVSYPDWTANLPDGLADFKPAPIVNKGVGDGMDEVLDGETFKELTVNEELLSYLFLRRFGNKFGWTPVMIANDNLGAFQEEALGMGQAWEFTINDLCLGLLTSNAALLDGVALYVAATTRGGASGNTRAAGTSPSDSEWAAMESQYADITGIGTTRRVRGTLNTILVPSGTPAQEARRTFLTFPVLGESKEAATTANVGLYRGQVRVVVEPELRASNTTAYYGFRNPTQISTATVVRAYFRGFGERGKREQWYCHETKTTWVSLEGRIGASVKSWRNTIHNAGTGGS